MGFEPERQVDELAGVPDAEWDAFVAAHPNGHVLQTSAWAELKTAFGWTASRVVLWTTPSSPAPPPERDFAIVGGASILFRKLPWGQTLAYVPKGPVVDWDDFTQARAVLTMAREVARKRRAALLKIEPELPASPELTELLVGLGFRSSQQRVQPLSTIHVDLTADEETILARMKSKWRYNIRLAERKGVTVREGTAADLPAIQRLMDVTAERDGFAVHSAEYYRKATELFVPKGLATWLIAEHGGEMLAVIAVFAVGRCAWYMWGASSDSSRNLMPNHALQWAGMCWAKSRGCEIYDLWGIPDEVGEHPDAYVEPESWGEGGLWGIYRFKQGFGGRVVRYAGAWDMPVSSVGYWIYRFALRARRE
jgi:lipid II:glycine glycyltransferase (peptidoglycan interpeptide bridge formation enzyme)